MRAVRLDDLDHVGSSRVKSGWSGPTCKVESYHNVHKANVLGRPVVHI